MAYLYNTVLNVGDSLTSFLPYCNAPIAVDYSAQHFQEVYYAPEPPPKIQVVRKRLPDPPPDIIERVVVVPHAKQVVYQVVEVPTKPPPVIQERIVHETPNPPLCGGTYRVQVPPKALIGPPRIARSPSVIAKSPSIIHGPGGYFNSPKVVYGPSPSPPPPLINL